MDMRPKKLFALCTLAVLLLSVPWCLVSARQDKTTPQAEVIKAEGCVQPGVEAGCLILKTFNGKQSYNVFFHDGKKPAAGRAISFEGVEHRGPATCMQRTPVDVEKWAPLKRRCPSDRPHGDVSWQVTPIRQVPATPMR
jgi:hypothetical protein